MLLRLFFVVILMVVSGCASIDSNGNVCYDREINNCELYIPLYSASKLFIKGAVNQ